jgi:hypothetical protein
MCSRERLAVSRGAKLKLTASVRICGFSRDRCEDRYACIYIQCVCNFLALTGDRTYNDPSVTIEHILTLDLDF